MNNERLLGSVPAGHDYLDSIRPTTCQSVKIRGSLMRGERRRPGARHGDHHRLFPTRPYTGEHVGLVSGFGEQASLSETPKRTRRDPGIEESLTANHSVCTLTLPGKLSVWIHEGNMPSGGDTSLRGVSQPTLRGSLPPPETDSRRNGGGAGSQRSLRESVPHRGRDSRKNGVVRGVPEVPTSESGFRSTILSDQGSPQTRRIPISNGSNWPVAKGLSALIRSVELVVR